MNMVWHHGSKSHIWRHTENYFLGVRVKYTVCLCPGCVPVRVVSVQVVSLSGLCPCPGCVCPGCVLSRLRPVQVVSCPGYVPVRVVSVRVVSVRVASCPGCVCPGYVVAPTVPNTSMPVVTWQQQTAMPMLVPIYLFYFWLCCAHCLCYVLYTDCDCMLWDPWDWKG